MKDGRLRAVLMAEAQVLTARLAAVIRTLAEYDAGAREDHPADSLDSLPDDPSAGTIERVVRRERVFGMGSVDPMHDYYEADEDLEKERAAHQRRAGRRKRVAETPAEPASRDESVSRPQSSGETSTRGQ